MEARGYFSRALALNPREARALIGLGMCSAFENKHAEGHEFFVKALEVDPGANRRALHQLVQSSHVLGRFEALEKALRRYQPKIRETLSSSSALRAASSNKAI